MSWASLCGCTKSHQQAALVVSLPHLRPQLQQQTAAHAAGAAPPQTMQEALTSPHGRPPVALLAFGFGGRVVVMRPRPRQPLPVSPPQGVKGAYGS